MNVFLLCYTRRATVFCMTVFYLMSLKCSLFKVTRFLCFAVTASLTAGFFQLNFPFNCEAHHSSPVKGFDDPVKLQFNDPV